MMKTINLLPKEELRALKLELVAGQVFRLWLWILITLALFFALSVASTILLTRNISANNNEIQNKRQSLSSDTTKQLEQEVFSLNQQIRLIDTLRRDHYYWSKVLVELSYLVDTDTVITTAQMDRETGKVTIYGTAGDRESVLAFWAAVKKTRLFKDIDFPLTNLERDIDADFNFSFYVKPEEMKKE